MNEDKRKRYTRRGAIGLMGVGAVGVASETLGFTNLTARRGVNVGVEGDLNADLIIEAADDQVNLGGDGEELGTSTFDDEVFIRFENNTTDREISVGDPTDGSADDTGTISDNNFNNFSVNDVDEDVQVDDPNFNFELSDSGDSVDIKVTNDTADKTISLTLEIDGGEIGDTIISLTRDFDIDTEKVE